MKRHLHPLACLPLLLLLTTLCRADGLIIIHDPPVHIPNHFPFAPLEVTYHHVDVTIDDQIATTAIDQEFYNPNNARLEGTYIFPLPAGAHIDKFAMDIDGKMAEAELLSADKARAIYEEIVRKQRDPALLEYLGRDAFKVRIFPIEPNSRKHIQIKYTQLLKTDSTSETSLTEYTYPLSTEKFSSRPLKDLSIRVTLACKQSLKSIYSPSHNVEIRRDGDTRATVGYEDHNVRPDTDFKLLFSTNKKLGIEVLAYRDGPDDGYFMLMASPGFDVKQSQVQPKDVCFVLDTSGSMAGAKIDQAKKALAFCLANLNEVDRFNIIRFSTEVEPLFDDLQPASKENIDRANFFVKDLKAIGGTAIYDALSKAISQSHNTDPKRTSVIIFLTDGLPTVGDRDENHIVALSAVGPQAQASSRPRIFTFGLGTDVNTQLLDRLANETKAVSQYVLPAEDIEVKVSNFYEKIASPVVTNVKVTISGATAMTMSGAVERMNDLRAMDMYPATMPDLYKGDTLIAFGRYKGAGEASVHLTGDSSSGGVSMASEFQFPKSDTAHPFVARLWATRRVGWLLDEIRLHGENAELKDEVTRLARQFGIVTPYTAYLIVEDEQKRNVPALSQTMRELSSDKEVRARSFEYYDSARLGTAQEKSGDRAIANSAAVNDLKYSRSEQAAQNGLALAKAPAQAGAAGGYRFAQNYAQQSKLINGRAFYQNGQTWTDSTAQARKDLKQQQIKFNTDDYFTLLKNHPEAAAWLALSTDVDIVLDDTLYQIRS